MRTITRITIAVAVVMVLILLGGLHPITLAKPPEKLKVVHRVVMHSLLPHASNIEEICVIYDKDKEVIDIFDEKLYPKSNPENQQGQKKVQRGLLNIFRDKGVDNEKRICIWYQEIIPGQNDPWVQFI
ncbi:MAG: hypothetical protein Q7K40_03395 [bacterium]|nr:hypothetical protein [bacterium]